MDWVAMTKPVYKELALFFNVNKSHSKMKTNRIKYKTWNYRKVEETGINIHQISGGRKIPKWEVI